MQGERRAVLWVEDELDMKRNQCTKVFHVEQHFHHYLFVFHVEQVY